MNTSLTTEQEKVVSTNVSLRQALKVVAFAGTGKTSTLYAYAKARPRETFLYLAFNKAIADEGRRKFPRNVECRTSHSLAFAEYGRPLKHKLVPGIKANHGWPLEIPPLVATYFSPTLKTGYVAGRPVMV